MIIAKQRDRDAGFSFLTNLCLYTRTIIQDRINIIKENKTSNNWKMLSNVYKLYYVGFFLLCVMFTTVHLMFH